MPILYAVTRVSDSDEVVGLQRKKQASNPILRKFSRAKRYTVLFLYSLNKIGGMVRDMMSTIDMPKSVMMPSECIAG